MKNLNQFINERLSYGNKQEVWDLVKEITDLVKKDPKITDKVIDDAEEDFTPAFHRIIDKYDEYMSDIVNMLLWPRPGLDVDEFTKEIIDMTEENEMRNGTESQFLVSALEEILDFIKR